MPRESFALKVKGSSPFFAKIQGSGGCVQQLSATIHKLMEKGALRDDAGPDSSSLEDNMLNASEDYRRVMTALGWGESWTEQKEARGYNLEGSYH